MYYLFTTLQVKNFLRTFYTLSYIFSKRMQPRIKKNEFLETKEGIGEEKKICEVYFYGHTL